MTPLVSIIIPAYNTERWIKDSIESALSQTWLRKEIIVVDDGSNDRTFDIAKTFESEIVIVFRQDHKNASAARNHGLKMSQGKYIQYLDADDVMACNKIELQMKILNDSHSLDYVSACSWGRFYNRIEDAKFIPEPTWADLDPVEWIILAWEKNLMMHPAAWLAPRSIIDKAGLWDESLTLNDDGEYFCRVLLNSQGIKFCHDAKTYYRSGNPRTLSSSLSELAMESFFKAIDLCAQNLISKENSRRTRHACASSFKRFIRTAYPYVPKLIKIAESRVQQFGGTDLNPTCLSPTFEIISRILGWKIAKRLQLFVYSRIYKIIIIK